MAKGMNGKTNALKSSNFFSKRNILFVVLALCGVLAVSISGYAAYYGFTNRALPGSYVGDLKVSGLSEKQIVAKLDNVQAQGKIKVVGKGITTQEVSLNELGYKLESEATAKEVLKRNKQVLPYLKGLFMRTVIEPKKQVDSNALNALSVRISEGLPGAKAPQEPKVVLNQDAKDFSVVAGTNGYGVSVKNLLEAAQKTVYQGKTVECQLEYGVVTPVATEEQAQALAEKARKLAQLKAEIKYSDQVFAAGEETRHTWVKIPEVAASAEPEIDDEAVKNWLGTIREKIDVARVNGVKRVNQAGMVLRQDNDPVDGHKLVNLEELAKSAQKSLHAGSDYSGEARVEVDKAEWEEKTVVANAGTLPWPALPGEKWIDVNLSQHTVTAYEGGKVVMGPYLMNHGHPETPTIRGVFHVLYKKTSDRMRGFNRDGTKYDIPNVPWAVYFDNRGYAIHGAPWANEFGFAGDRGTHGCVNLPVPTAQMFFNWAPVGTTVVSHL